MDSLNTSRYPCHNISDLQNWGNANRTTTFNKWICFWLLKLEIYWKYCGSSVGAICPPFFHNIFFTCYLLNFHVKTGTRFSLRDKWLFEKSEVELTILYSYLGGFRRRPIDILIFSGNSLCLFMQIVSLCMRACVRARVCVVKPCDIFVIHRVGRGLSYAVIRVVSQTSNKSSYLYLLMYKMSSKHCRTRSDAAYCGVWSCSTLFAQACLWMNIYSKPKITCHFL